MFRIAKLGLTLNFKKRLFAFGVYCFVRDIMTGFLFHGLFIVAFLELLDVAFKIIDDFRYFLLATGSVFARLFDSRLMLQVFPRFALF